MSEEATAMVPSKQKAVVNWKGESITITFQDVKTLLCPRASDQEITMFLRTCQSLQLNPFASECYLIKYSTDDKAALVVAIDAYLKAAEVNEHYDGCEAGIVLKHHTGPIELREGAFLLDNEREDLVGGWARVYRKDRSRPTYVAVNKAECIRLNREGKPTQFWTLANQPWMLRKVALKRAHCEAFPSLFAGTLSTAEVSGDIQDVEYREIPEGTLPPGMEKDGKPDWSKFWTRVKSELQLTQTQARELLQVESLKKDLISKGASMAQVWEDLIVAVQNAKAAESAERVVEPETGEIITPETGDTLEQEIFGEGKEEPSPPEAPSKPKRDPNTITNLGQLFTACKDDFGLYSDAVCNELNVASASQITDLPSECYRRIAAVRR